ncbi:MAG: acyl-ACP--UDP-N-acetylglucosamine O-acyltransferase [Verrucomicrobiota bacterium]
MNRFHPTAIIHRDAKFGTDVKIGPYAVIEGAAEIGAGCVIQAHAVITGNVRMGANNTIGYGAIIGADPQDYAFDPATESLVVIGDNNRIREHVTIHRGTGAGTETRLGNNCFLMTGVHVGHNAQIGDRVVIANNVLLAGHVHIDDGVFIGGGAVFHQFIRVGRQAIVQGNSAMSKDVPPYLIGCTINSVAGLNSIGLRRSGLSAATRLEIKIAFKLLYMSGLNTAQALAAAKERTWGPEAEAFFEFVAKAKRRGICDLVAGRSGQRGEVELD